MEVPTHVAARILTGPWTNAILMRRVGPITAIVTLPPAGTRLFYINQNVLMPNPAANFPFGFNVEPDLPL